MLRGAPAPAHVHKTDPCDHPPHSHPHHSHPHPNPEGSMAAHDAPAPAPAPAQSLALPLLDEPTLSAALRLLPKESVYRVKGFIRFAATAPPMTATDADADDSEDKPRRQWWILNWAFGRWELVRASTSSFSGADSAADEDEDGDERGVVRLTVMGERGEVRRKAKRLAEALGAAVVN